MEGTSTGVDYLNKYKNISQKLKKRFLRKPNVAEASEEFGQLARSLSDGEAWPQAGLCCLAVARCEQTLANVNTEVSAVTEAARYFLKALKALRHQSEALGYFWSAADLMIDSPVYYLTCLEHIASCEIELGNLDGALSVFTQMIEVVEKHSTKPMTRAFKDILAKCEISTLLILLTLKPISQRAQPIHIKLLEKYSSTSMEAILSLVPFEDKELLILLQSLVLAAQSADTEVLGALGEGLTPLLSAEQLDLLNILFKEIRRT